MSFEKIQPEKKEEEKDLEDVVFDLLEKLPDTPKKEKLREFLEEGEYDSEDLERVKQEIEMILQKIEKPQSGDKKISYPSIENGDIAYCERMVRGGIKKIEQDGFEKGRGRTGKVLTLKEDSSICLKVITNKSEMLNTIQGEMGFLDELSRKGYPVPMPICAIESSENDYLSMETIQGFSLEDLMEKNLFNQLPDSFDIDKFFDSLEKVVDRMHKEEGIYHRDLHPGNIMINEKGNPIIIDFGNAAKIHLLSQDPYRIDEQFRPKSIIMLNDEESIKKNKKIIKEYLDSRK